MQADLWGNKAGAQENPIYQALPTLLRFLLELDTTPT